MTADVVDDSDCGDCSLLNRKESCQENLKRARAVYFQAIGWLANLLYSVTIYKSRPSIATIVCTPRRSLR
jgi:hypothetical protein